MSFLAELIQAQGKKWKQVAVLQDDSQMEDLTIPPLSAAQ